MQSIVNQILDFLSQNAGIASTVFGVILVFIAKIFPNADAPKAIVAIQKIVDAAAGAVDMLGKLLHGISGFLSNLIKSDGIGGKQ